MSPPPDDSTAPEGYVRLDGSERRPAKQATLLGPVDESETFSVTIQLRRRADGPPLPDFEYFVRTPPPQRKGLDVDEFASMYGAHPDVVQKVVAFAEGHGLKVTKTSLGRRTVVVSGSASQFSRAFGVTFGRYQEPPERPGPRKAPPRPTRSYRGRDGFIYLPEQLSETIVGVFGLDNRHVGHRSNNPGDPPIINTLTVQQVAQLYNFPSPGPAIGEQTIGIIAPTGGYGGYLQSDIDQTFSAIGLTAPQVIPISVDNVVNGTARQPRPRPLRQRSAPKLSSSVGARDPERSVGQYTIAGSVYYFLVTALAGATLTIEAADPNTGQLVTTGLYTVVPAGTTVYFNLDGETNQDVCISASAAPGANMAVYFTDDTQAGWIDLIHRVLEPESGDFPPGVTPPSVLSASWSIAPGDNPDGLAYADSNWGTGVTVNALQAMTAAFQDAAILQSGPTICIASGDLGSNCGVGRMASTSTSFAGDGYAHVVYPASDPWVLSIGGTTIGQYQLANSTQLGWSSTRGTIPSRIPPTHGERAAAV